VGCFAQLNRRHRFRPGDARGGNGAKLRGMHARVCSCNLVRHADNCADGGQVRCCMRLHYVQIICRGMCHCLSPDSINSALNTNCVGHEDWLFECHASTCGCERQNLVGRREEDEPEMAQLLAVLYVKAA
jgi:hypothetical protein